MAEGVLVVMVGVGLQPEWLAWVLGAAAAVCVSATCWAVRA